MKAAFWGGSVSSLVVSSVQALMEWIQFLFPEGRLSFQTAPVEERGDELLADRQLDAAVDSYRAWLKVDPSGYRKAANRLKEAAYLRKHRDVIWSIRALKSALHFDPQNAQAHLMLAELLHMQRDESSLYHLEKGMAQQVKGKPRRLPADPSAALAVVKIRLAKNPQDLLLRRYQAHLLTRTGKREEAIRAYLELAEEKGWLTPPFESSSKP